MSATNPNPWVSQPEEEAPEVAAESTPEVRTTGPVAPQKSVAPPTASNRIPFADRTPARLWVMGVHGGAGETTLASLAPGWRAAGHEWPNVKGQDAPVVLVARTHASGLRAAQAAAIQWASGQAPGVELLGLVLVHDAPGKLPKELRELIQVISGGVPRTWSVPWVEAWRLGAEPTSDAAPKDVRRFVSELDSLTESTTKGNHS